MLLRGRPLAPAGILPAPAPLPNLRDALSRRATIFGPVEAERLPAAPGGLRQAIATALRGAARLLEPRVFA